MPMKIKKRRKSGRQRGNTTYGHGARKKWKGSGHHGGIGMAGSGKRADQKKSLVIKLYGNKYFGKQGITSKSTAKKVNEVMNLEQIQSNLDSLMKKFGKISSLSKDNENSINSQTFALRGKASSNEEKGKELVLEDFKILGEGELNEKLTIKAKDFSESAKAKIEKAGGKAILIKSDKEKDKASAEIESD